MQIKRLIVSALIAYVIGLSAYLLSFFVPVLDDAEAQANMVLSIALIPAAMLGAWFYYKQHPEKRLLALGLPMFGIAMCLDALITVPLFIIPNGGSYAAFFGDPGFWIIGLEYVIVVGIYAALRHKRMVPPEIHY